MSPVHFLCTSTVRDQNGISMKGRSVVITGLVVATVVLYPFVALSRTGGSPASRTGAPITNSFNESTCGTSDECHDDADVNSGSGQVIIEAPSGYTPGASYEFKVRVEQEGISTFGFQVAVKAFDESANLHNHVGTLELVDAVTTRMVTNNYVTHTEDGIHQNEWTVRWTAPSTDVGDVTIYASGNAANGDEKRTGDHIYTTSHTFDVITARDELPQILPFHLHRAYPNPFTTQATIHYDLDEATSVVVTLFDAQGRAVRIMDQGMQARGSYQINLSGNGLAAGLYLCELSTPQGREARPLLLMK